MRSLKTEFLWFWAGLFLLAAEKCVPNEPSTGLAVRQAIRKALDAIPTT